MGRLTADPELKKTDGDVSVCSFTVAVDRDFVKKGEERLADFIDVVAWRQQAEFVSKHFRKGSMIAVDGKLQTRNWEDRNGSKRKNTEIVADNINFCGDKVEKKTEEPPKKEIAPTVVYDPYYEVPEDTPF